MIHELVNTLKEGARTNKYRLNLYTPIADSIEQKELDILVTSTTMPSKTITPVEVFLKGKKVQIRGETNIENTWDVTVYNTSDMKIRENMLRWMDIVHYNKWKGTPATGIKSMVSGIKDVIKNPTSLLNSGTNTYQKDIKIEQLDNDGNVTFYSTLIGAFPINISTVELNDSNSEISETTITFAFSDIEYGIKGSGVTFNKVIDFIENIS
jgi:hypothetical protein